MTRRQLVVAARMAAMLVVLVAGYAVLHRPWQAAEAVVAAAIAGALGPGQVDRVADAALLVAPPAHTAFIAIVTPACSSAAPVLALACLGLATPAAPPRRQLGALCAAAAAVMVGNAARIAGSVGVGLLAGRQSLVLFHDWVGSAFGFAYVLGGYVLMLSLLLPPRRVAADVA